jgi:hypothetical protein
MSPTVGKQLLQGLGSLQQYTQQRTNETINEFTHPQNIKPELH